MERHKCKLCMRSFSNGRALGGHMRSHMMNLPIPAKPELEEEEEVPPGRNQDQVQLLIDELAEENPKRSIRLVDPEFSFAVDAGSVVLQDRESETESSKNPTRRRSKRTRKSAMLELHHQYQNHHQKLEALKKIKLKNKVISSSKTDSFEPEPVSSISDATTEEDVAFCLMMLSRDKWKKQDQQHHQQQHQHEQEQDQDDEAERSMEDSDESEEQLVKFPRTRTTRGKYKCETCNKVFKSYQALGGHRASHKKIKASNPNPIYEHELEQENNAGASSVAERKTHECPVCFRVFSSGQALGGHKRSHVTGSAAAAATHVKNLNKLGDNLIDLNLPAPVEDDEISQIELSAVSDAEFVNPIRR
ncbi:C2H2-like zinc finger protein [Prunus dulcis]|uniref:C2H2-like zinc finger protein n=1 Tax=Prunus dulcis TaxID=3755 RepID=A0A4Y1QZV1_PRUDU|nr:C2H2-like zinc finger protein [Prunus dulcis]